MADLYHRDDGLLSATPSYRFTGGVTEAPQQSDEPTILVAARRGDAKEVRRFVAAGGDVNASNKDAETALHAAAARGRTDTVLMLLDLGADAKRRTKAGKTALELATDRKHDAVVTILKRRGGLSTELSSRSNRPRMILNTEDEPGYPKPATRVHTSTGHQRGPSSLATSASTSASAQRSLHTSANSPSSASSASFAPHPPRGPRTELTPSPILTLGRQHRRGGGSAAGGAGGPPGMRRESSGSNASRPRWTRMNSHGSTTALLLDQLDGVPSDPLAVSHSPHQSPGGSGGRTFFRSNSGHSFEDSLAAVIPSHGQPRKPRHVNSPLVPGRPHANSPLAPRGERRSSSHGSSGDGRDDGGVTDHLTELTLRRAELWLGVGGSGRGGDGSHCSQRHVPSASAMRQLHEGGSSHRGIAFGPRSTSGRELHGSGGSPRMSSLATAASSVVSPRAADQDSATPTAQAGGSGRNGSGGGTWFGAGSYSQRSRGSGIVTGHGSDDLVANVTPINARRRQEAHVPRPPAEPSSGAASSPRAARSQRVMNGMTMMKSTGSYVGASATDSTPQAGSSQRGGTEGSDRPLFGRRAAADAGGGYTRSSQRGSRLNPASDLDALLAETGCDLPAVTPMRRESSHNADRRSRMNRGEFIQTGAQNPPPTGASAASDRSLGGLRSSRLNVGAPGSNAGSVNSGGGWSSDRWGKGATQGVHSGGSGTTPAAYNGGGSRYGTASNRLRSVARRLLGS